MDQKQLVDLFRRLAAMNASAAEEAKDNPHLKGLKTGSAQAFRLAAEWLEEIIGKDVSP